MTFYDELNPKLIDFIGEQKIFFTATAPEQGRISLSPKGMDCLRCFSPRQVGYLDATGSGNETAAHVQQNGRLTLMFCSFAEQPLILRLYGRGETIGPRSPRWAELRPRFNGFPGERQIILLNIESVQTSCGFGVPHYEFVCERTRLREWAADKGADGIREYQQQKNRRSIDGLPVEL